MLTYENLKQRPKEFLACTGLCCDEFDTLLPSWIDAWERNAKQYYFSRAGRKPILSDDREKLLFILVYYKIYPLQSVQGVLFGMSQGQASYWIHRLTTVLMMALNTEQCLPERNPARLPEILEQYPTLSYIIDGVEHPRQRPQNSDDRHDFYSKKKRHTPIKILL